jgi:uncharacterized membrane protein (UPF0127 family)
MPRLPRRCDIAHWIAFALAAVLALASVAAAQVRPEIARTPEQLQYGLMFRNKLATDAGMLFIYDRPQRISMWMKNTLIPLDMIFIGADGRIVDIAERRVPHSIEPVYSSAPALAVLEVNGGTASRLGIKPGDRILSEAFRPS